VVPDTDTDDSVRGVVVMVFFCLLAIDRWIDRASEIKDVSASADRAALTLLCSCRVTKLAYYCTAWLAMAREHGHAQISQFFGSYAEGDFGGRIFVS